MTFEQYDSKKTRTRQWQIQIQIEIRNESIQAIKVTKVNKSNGYIEQQFDSHPYFEVRVCSFNLRCDLDPSDSKQTGLKVYFELWL